MAATSAAVRSRDQATDADREWIDGASVTARTDLKPTP
jgi:hypothetical protein